MPYPPGIPMLMSGENFGGADSPQIGYLRGMQNREEQFPGFAGVIEGAEMTHGSYDVLCVKHSRATMPVSRTKAEIRAESMSGEVKSIALVFKVTVINSPEYFN